MERGCASLDMDVAALQDDKENEYVRRMHHRAIYQVNEALHVTIHTPRTEDRWMSMKRDKHFEMYARRDNTARSVCFLAVNEIFCGFEEVHKLLRCENSAEFQYTMKLLYGRSFRDGGLVPLNMTMTEADMDSDIMDAAHSNIWLRLQERQRAVLGRERKLSFFQSLMILQPDCVDLNTNGSTVSVYTRPSESIKKRTLALAWLPIAETSDREQPDVRLHYTLIVEEVGRQRLRVSCVATSHRDGDDAHSLRASRTLARRFVARLISNLDSAVVAIRLSTQTPIALHRWVRDEDRVSCVICWKPFNSVFRRRHHCRLCGEVVCRWCSSLRCTNAMRGQELERVRICHMCSNSRRDKNESIMSTASHPFQATSTRADSEAFSSALYPSRHSLPYGLPEEPVDTTFQGFAGEEMKPKGKLSSNFEDSRGSTYRSSITSTPSVKVSRRKTISIKDLPQSTVTRRSLPPAFFSVKPAKKRYRRQSIDGSPCAPDITIAASRHRHSDVSSLSDMPSTRTDLEQMLASSNSNMAEAGSQAKAEETEDACNTAQPRRTSILSLGMLDGFVGDDLSCAPRLDPTVEINRLKLMNVICSPACTLVDRTLMRRCCEIVASAFNVEAAFIARVEGRYVVIEHATGTDQLAPTECFLRHEALCDYVLVQDGEPIVIVDCATDPRTFVRENVMAHDLGIHLFAGISIRVRGLPIACICTFGQHEDASNGDAQEYSEDTLRQQMKVLKKAAREIELDLDRLVDGLVLL